MVNQAHLEFHSTYWHENAGINFTQYYMGDPLCRLNSLKIYNEKMKQLYQRLKVTNSFQSQAIDPIVYGYGVATVPMILGCKVIFADDKDPYAESLDLTDEEVMQLTPEKDFSNNPVVQDLEQQAAWLMAKYGKACIHINYQSPPNVALKLRGEQLMIDFFEKPEIAKHIIEYTRVSLINLRKWFNEVNRRNNYPSYDRLFSLDNCTVALLSPNIYRDFFLPGDKKSFEEFKDNFGIHHCGGNMHLFAEYYGSMPGARWYDIGYGSDIKQCLNKFNMRAEDALISVRYGPAKLLHAKPGDIVRELDDINSCGATTILCLGAESNTHDDNIRAYLSWTPKEPYQHNKCVATLKL